jgi:hypothetical protein
MSLFATRGSSSECSTVSAAARDLREKVLGSVCARFATVLGPGLDGCHEDHIHLDLTERKAITKSAGGTYWIPR